MLRAIMAGLICLAAGMQAALRLGQRVHALRIWQDALENIGAYCASLRLPPGKILQRSAENLPGLEKLLAHPEAAADFLRGFSLTQEERTLIEACLRALFDGTQEQQERQLRHACKRLEQRLTEAEEKQRQDAKLYGMLGVFGGLSIFLLCL